MDELPRRRGGRRDVPRSSLAARPRRSHIGRGRYADEPEAELRERYAGEPRPRDEQEKKERPDPRPPTAEMLARMADWSPQEIEASQRVVDFFETELMHTEGEQAGKPFLLEPWQEWITRQVFGRLRADGTRRYRIVYIEIPRKNGKTTWCAGFALYLLERDGEPGSKVFSAAVDKTSAKICFETARTMVIESPTLSERILPFQGALECVDGTGAKGRYEVLAADPKGKKTHGKNVHGAVVDELHAHPNRKLWDVIRTGRGARRQPMIIVITTAGTDRTSVCWELHQKAIEIRDGKLVDDSFFGAVYGADEKDDPFAEETWRKANPNYGRSKSADYMREEAAEAKRSPAYLATFKQLELNVWPTQQAQRLINLSEWDACRGDIEEAGLVGLPCCAAVDLGSTRDLSVLAIPFAHPDGFFSALFRFFMPEGRLEERCQQDGVPYDAWARMGLLTLTPGRVLNAKAIRLVIVDEFNHFRFRDLAYDPWSATQLVDDLRHDLGEESDLPEEEQLRLVEFRQGFRSMSEPIKDFVDIVTESRLRTGGHPILDWMAENVVGHKDRNGNVTIDKSEEKMRIDGIVALIMAINRLKLLVASLAAAGQDAIETRGLRSI